MPAPLSLLSPCSIGTFGLYHTEHLKRQIRACARIVDSHELLVPAKALSLSTTNLHEQFEAQGEEHCPKGCINGGEEMWALLTYCDLSSAPFFNDNCSLLEGKTSSVIDKTFQLDCSAQVGKASGKPRPKQTVKGGLSKNTSSTLN